MSIWCEYIIKTTEELDIDSIKGVAVGYIRKADDGYYFCMKTGDNNINEITKVVGEKYTIYESHNMISGREHGPFGEVVDIPDDKYVHWAVINGFSDKDLYLNVNGTYVGLDEFKNIKGSSIKYLVVDGNLVFSDGINNKSLDYKVLGDKKYIVYDCEGKEHEVKVEL